MTGQKQQRTVIITGATAGIGLAAARLYRERGYKVYCFARRPSEEFAHKCVDITDKDAVERAVQEVYDAEGRIDVLINNAGMGISGAVEDTDTALVRKIFDVNVFGALNMIQAVIPRMREQGDGVIVNVSSAAAPLSLPFQSFYSATKAALSSLTEALRLEVAPFGIRVTSILPGDVKTDFTKSREKNAFDNPVYGERISRSLARMEHDEQNGMPPSVIAKAIVKLSERKNPPVAKVGGASYAVLVTLAKFLPKRTVGYIIGKLYG